MSKKMFGGIFLALVLAWGGTATAQIQDQCSLDGEVSQELTFPYFAGTLENDGWWSGLAIINTTGNVIPAGDLCVVGVNQRTQTGVPLPDDLGANSMYVNLIEGYSAAFAKPFTSVSVFTNNEMAKGSLRGFGMVGDGVQGQGYLALRGENVAGATTLEIPYAPENPWWKGFAVVNNTAAPQDITFTAYYADGTKNEFKAENVPALEMVVGVPGTEAFWPAFNGDQRARIVMEATGNIFGFAMFGDGQQAQGLVAPN